MVLSKEALEADDFEWTNELAADLMPSSFDDFQARRAEILHRHAYPLYITPNGKVPRSGFLASLPWLAPPGQDFIRRFEKYAGMTPQIEPLKGLRGKVRKEVDERNLKNLAAFNKELYRYLEYLYVRALYDSDFKLRVALKGRHELAHFVSGTFKTPDGAIYGPRRADIMIVGKFPGEAEVRCKENFVGNSSQVLMQACDECQIPRDELGNWYFTNLVKHPGLDPSKTKLESSWIKNCAPLLDLELRLVNPKYLLCFGSEASKHLIDPKANVTAMYGRVVTKEFDDRPSADAPVSNRKVFTMAVVHPAYVAREPKAYQDLANGIGVFYGLVQGNRTSDREFDVTHVNIYTARHLKRVVDEIIAESGKTQVIAVDCEWHGDHPDEPGAYLRTIQFSHKPKHAYCVVLRHQGGPLAFKPGLAAARAELTRLFKTTKDRKVRIGGHYFRADFPWLKKFGIDVTDEYRGAKTAKGSKRFGGWDTMTMAHAYIESIEGGYKLENLAARMVHVPRYDMALQAWKDGYCRDRKLKAKDLEGYGFCPDHILHPYAAYDCDATIRLFYYFNGTDEEPGKLDHDQYGNSCREAFWRKHGAMEAQLEMEAAGLEVDKQRGDELTKTFIDALDTRLKQFRDRIGWNGAKPFNTNSAEQCRELLFGTQLNGAIDKVTGENKRLRPSGVRSLNLTPVKAAGDKAPIWSKVVDEGLEAKYNPSTDKESLGILASFTPGEDGKTVGKLRDLRLLSQVLKGVLRKPTEMGGELIFDEGDALVYDGGLLYWVGHDGRVRTHFGLTETGRWSSWSANLQNISKRREDDYKRILGEFYKHPIRSILRAREGHVLIEADYKMAEMAVIGWLAQDPTMMEMVIRNSLDECDPRFIDLHSLTAIQAFKLDTPENRKKLADYNAKMRKEVAGWVDVEWSATKALLAAIGKKSLRVAAKNVNFGVPYGRSAEAIARQCREEGANVTVEEAQLLIDNYYRTYPMIGVFLDTCKSRVHDPGWMAGTFLRYRRFGQSGDREVMAKQEREAGNFRIQNAVAECVDISCKNFTDFRRDYTGPHRFTMVLQIHDALLFEVPFASVEWMVDHVIPLCMRDRVDIWPRDFDGNLLPGIESPYHLDVDLAIERWWGEKIDREWGLGVGLPEKTAGGVRILPKAKAT